MGLFVLAQRLQRPRLERGDELDELARIEAVEAGGRLGRRGLGGRAPHVGAAAQELLDLALVAGLAARPPPPRGGAPLLAPFVDGPAAPVPGRGGPAPPPPGVG